MTNEAQARNCCQCGGEGQVRSTDEVEVQRGISDACYHCQTTGNCNCTGCNFCQAEICTGVHLLAMSRSYPYGMNTAQVILIERPEVPEGRQYATQLRITVAGTPREKIEIAHGHYDLDFTEGHASYQARIVELANAEFRVQKTANAARYLLVTEPTELPW